MEYGPEDFPMWHADDPYEPTGCRILLALVAGFWVAALVGLYLVGAFDWLTPVVVGGR